MPAAHPLWIGNPIAGQPFAQVFGFADVNHGVAAIAHQIHPWFLGYSSEKLRSQPFYQRSWVWKKEHLCHDSATTYTNPLNC
jgi:hypothetical protein